MQGLEDMMTKEAEVLVQYTTMGKTAGAKASAPKNLVTDFENTVAPLSLQSIPPRQAADAINLKARTDFLSTFHECFPLVVLLISMMAFVMMGFKSALRAACMCLGSKGNLLKAYKYR